MKHVRLVAAVWAASLAGVAYLGAVIAYEESCLQKTQSVFNVGRYPTAFKAADGLVPDRETAEGIARIIFARFAFESSSATEHSYIAVVFDKDKQEWVVSQRPLSPPLTDRLPFPPDVKVEYPSIRIAQKDGKISYFSPN